MNILILSNKNKTPFRNLLNEWYLVLGIWYWVFGTAYLPNT